MFLNSDVAAGAQNVSADGSRFEVNLNAPLIVPRDALVCEVGVIRAAIWNTSPNVSPTFGNTDFPFVASGTPYTIVVPEGLWSLDALDSYLSSQFVNLGLSATLFRLGGVGATNQSVIVFEAAGDSVDFSGPGTIRTLLGFDAGVYTSTSAGESIASQNTADFNRNNSYLITTTMIDGLQVNANTSGVLTQVPISAPPGSQINFDPRQIIWIATPELIGSQRTNLVFQLTNEVLEATPTAGETWSFVLSIRWEEP